MTDLLTAYIVNHPSGEVSIDVPYYNSPNFRRLTYPGLDEATIAGGLRYKLQYKTITPDQCDYPHD